MKLIGTALADHLAGGVTTLSRCWRIERKDGTVLGFTDHDRDLAFDGTTYTAATGFTASAIEDQLGLAVSNLAVEGAFSSGAITEDDLHAGRWDDAKATIYLVNWRDVTQRLILRSGTLGSVERGQIGFSVELRGLAAPLDQVAGRVFQRSCPWTLGDARCQVDLTASGRHGGGTVASVVSSLAFTASGFSAIAAGVFNRGKLVWATGDNAGLAVELRAHLVSAGVARLMLFLPMGGAIAVGDTFTITAGCDKTLVTCRDRFANAVNFGGFPHMPGDDYALSYAVQGSQNDGGAIR